MKKFFHRITQSYNNLRLQTKLTITHFVIVTIPVVAILLLFFTKLYDMILSDTIRNEQEASFETTPLIEAAISDILAAHTQLTDHAFYEKLINPARTESFEELIHSEEAAGFKRKMQSLSAGDLIGDIRLYLDVPDSDPYFSDFSVRKITEPLERTRRTYWYGIFAGTPTANDLFCPAFYLSTYEIQNYGDIAYISKSRAIYKGEWITVYFAIYFSKEQLNDILKSSLNSDNSVAYIINNRDSMVVSTDAALSGTYHFSYETVQDSVMSSNNFIMKTILDEDVYAGFNHIKYTDWYMITAIPSKPLIQKSRIYMGIFVLIYLVCIVSAFMVATLLSRSLTKRLGTVINQMGKCRLGLPCALPDSDTQDEIGELVDSYNYMTHMIHKLVDEQAKTAETLRISEFNSLQAQINPHFLYNTMDMINWLAQQGRPHEVSEAIQNLSRFYKLTLSRKQSLSTIQDEVEHVTIYVSLQNMRFDGNIDFIVDIPDELLEHSIPKLTLQPVIENCILHGIMEKKEKKGTIVLTSWQEESSIVILISDDGIGIPPEKLKNILSEKQISAGAPGTNIAIYNTHRRLQLIYGAAYGLKYTSTPGNGTDAEIRIPK